MGNRASGSECESDIWGCANETCVATPSARYIVHVATIATVHNAALDK